MLIRDLNKCKKIIAGDNSTLRELINPLKDALELHYSIAHAIVKPGKATLLHCLKGSEVYFILKGKGAMDIGGERVKVKENQAIYVPPNAEQKIKNTGKTDLEFLCIADPAWKKQDEKIL